MPDNFSEKILKVTEYQQGASWIKTNVRSAPPDLIVLHETAGASGFSSYEWGLSQKTGYHFIIDRPWHKPAEFNDPKWDGQIWQLAPLYDPATNKWFATNHVGSKIKLLGSERSINDRAIGISFANMNDGSEKRTKLQRASCIELIQYLKETIPTLKYLTTHYDLQIWNRNDPLGFDPSYVDDIVGLEYVRPTDPELRAAAKRVKDPHAMAAVKRWIAAGRPVPG